MPVKRDLDDVFWLDNLSSFIFHNVLPLSRLPWKKERKEEKKRKNLHCLIDEFVNTFLLAIKLLFLSP